MRHKLAGYKLKRNLGSRAALLKGLVTSVIEHERVVTTVPKAKDRWAAITMPQPTASPCSHWP